MKNLSYLLVLSAFVGCQSDNTLENEGDKNNASPNVVTSSITQTTTSIDTSAFSENDNTANQSDVSSELPQTDLTESTQTQGSITDTQSMQTTESSEYQDSMTNTQTLQDTQSTQNTTTHTDQTTQSTQDTTVTQTDTAIIENSYILDGIEFTDSNLINCLKKQEVESIEDVTSFSCIGVQNSQNLVYLSKLQSLTLGGSNIELLNFDLLTQLESLTLNSSNSIGIVHLNNEKLHTLEINGGEYSGNIDISGLTQLETLVVGHTDIYEQLILNSDNKYTNINELSISYILSEQALDLANFPNLKKLKLKNMTVKSITLEENKLLEEVSFMNVAVEEIDLYHNRALTHIDARINNLQSLELPDSDSLQVLSLDSYAI
ncbi:MAG: hypothetical protein HRU38_25250, partial [Saccharospirillaceae bacterium]|nr:hypothetical protein [Pseudomonadales bacterium]NRB81924.1 hypothetical protein [Saccharospirillaceae bacterium]